jgi:hypothetical protein
MSAAAQHEGALVDVDGHTIQLDRAHHRGQAHRHQAALPGIAQHDDVGRDLFAQCAQCQVGRIDAKHVIVARAVAQLGQ